MSQQDVYRAPVTFQDVAAYFSEEEWKLLHEWQNELYENVIKEIQQAMTTLGPLIATSVFALRPNPKEDLFPVDHQFSKLRGHDTCSPSIASTDSDLSLSKKREASTYLKATQDIAQRHNSFCPSTEFSFHNSDIVLNKEHECETSVMDHHVMQPGETQSAANAGQVFTKPEIPFIIEVEGTYTREHQRAEKKEQTNIVTGHATVAPIVSFSSKDKEGETYFMGNKDSWGDNSNQTTVNAVNTSVVSLKIKEEGEPYIVDYENSAVGESISSTNEQKDIQQFVPFIIKEDGLAYSLGDKELEASGNINISTHDGAMRKKRKYTRRMHPFKAPFGRGRTKVFQGSRRGTYSVSLLWPRNNLELGEENTTLHGNDFINEAHSSLQQMTGTQSESVKRRTKYAPCPQNTTTVGEKIFSHTGSTVEDQGSSTQLLEVNLKRKLPYKSTQYEKTFDPMKTMVGPERAIIAEKPYTCFKCNKCFSQMASLIRHQSTHSEEKPFQCTECDKSYNRNDNLIRHQKSHMRAFCAT